MCVIVAIIVFNCFDFFFFFLDIFMQKFFHPIANSILISVYIG